MLQSNVVDQLHDENCLADARATKEANLSTTRVGGEKIYNLNARLEHLDFGTLFDEARRGAVNGGGVRRIDGAQLVDGLADDIHDSAENVGAYRNRDGAPGVLDGQAAGESIRSVHRDTADRVFTEVHRNLNDQVVFLVADEGIAHGESGVDVREFSGWKFHIHYGARDLDDLSGVV